MRLLAVLSGPAVATALWANSVPLSSIIRVAKIRSECARNMGSVCALNG